MAAITFVTKNEMSSEASSYKNCVKMGNVFLTAKNGKVHYDASNFVCDIDLFVCLSVSVSCPRRLD